ncbi:MAG: hypothetical protein QW175_05140 [Candidatus Bathyarchaeia archaeon]
MWKSPLASLAAAFLAALSRYDIEMLAWGGYPNIVTLSIIPLIFYMIFRENTPPKTSLAVSSLLIGTLFITHSLSMFTFTSIAIPFLIFSLILPRRPTTDKNKYAVFAASIIFGILIASPFIIHVFPVYAENVRKGIFTGSISENQRALLLTRVIPLYLVFMALVPTFSFPVFAKKCRDAFLNEVGVLFSLWIFIPALLTQFFRVGLYTDYLRFLHFLIFPLTVFFALLTDFACGFLAEVAGIFAKSKGFSADKKMFNSIFMSAALIFYTFGFIPFFSSPEGGFLAANYYCVARSQEFESIEWIRQKTATEALFVSNHGYGWWISGFGQRATLTSTDPQFLMIPHEFKASYIARTLLKTNFVLNNGFIEIAEDGGYLGRYNPMLSINCTKFLEPYPMLYLNESEVTIFYEVGNSPKMLNTIDIPPKNLTIETTQELACITIMRENAQLKFMRRVEILKDTKFAVVSMSVKSLSSDVSIQHIRVLLRAHGNVLQSEQTLGFVDINAGVFAQLIFGERKPLIKLFKTDKINIVELLYSIGSTEKVEIKMVMGGFEIEKVESEHIMDLLANMTSAWQNREPSNFPIKVFDYKEAIRSNGIAFIACQRKACAVERFAKDPMFNLVYINDRVAIFKVRGQCN